jgi:hypothetical protein
MSGTSVARFYDKLAEDYHLIYADRDASMRRQGDALSVTFQLWHWHDCQWRTAQETGFFQPLLVARAGDSEWCLTRGQPASR